MMTLKNKYEGYFTFFFVIKTFTFIVVSNWEDFGLSNIMILEQIYLWVKSIKSISLYPGIYNEKKKLL